MGFDTCSCAGKELVNLGDARVKLCKALESVTGPGQPLLVDYGVDEIDEGYLIKQEGIEEGEITAAETVAEDYAGKSWLPKEQHAANKKRMAEENLAAPYQRDKRRVEGTSTYHVGNRLAAAIASANNVDTSSRAVILFDTNFGPVAPVEVRIDRSFRKHLTLLTLLCYSRSQSRSSLSLRKYGALTGSVPVLVATLNKDACTFMRCHLPPSLLLWDSEKSLDGSVKSSLRTNSP